MKAAERADGVSPERKASAALGLVSAVGAYCGFAIPQVLSAAKTAADGYAPAFYGFVAFYLVAMGVTYACYLRPGATRGERI